jgi:hypothetical protein
MLHNVCLPNNPKNKDNIGLKLAFLNDLNFLIQ